MTKPNAGITCRAPRRFGATLLSILILLFVPPAMAVSIAVTKVSLIPPEAEIFEHGSWHVVAWDQADLDDTASWDPAFPTVINVPDATRGRCSFQAGLQLGQPPNPGVWFVRITVNGGEVLGFLPYLEAPQDPPGLRILTGYGPWFAVGPLEEVSVDDFLEVEVWVQEVGAEPIAALNIRSWFQCEWVLAVLFEDGFESGDTFAWTSTEPA